MTNDFTNKSTLQEIEERFDNDVERFSNLETGQTATIDAPLAMELITQAAIRSTPNIERTLDIGCGAGNNTIKLLQSLSTPITCDLNDLSQPMLDRATKRISDEPNNGINIFRGDFLHCDFPPNSYDVILAAAVLHHLRSDADWNAAFQKVYTLLKPGGSFWITDFVSHEAPPIQELMWDRYGEYLTHQGGEDYRDQVFKYIAKEDTPRSVTYQLTLLTQVGFEHVDILHKSSCFAAFGAIKSS